MSRAISKSVMEAGARPQRAVAGRVTTGARERDGGHGPEAARHATRNGAGAAVLTGPQVLTPDAIPAHVRQLCAETAWEMYLPERATEAGWARRQVVKRWLDVVLSAVGMVVLAPLFLLVAALVRASSPGPVLYAFTALGYRGRPFVCYKFRTMTVDADRRKGDLLHLNEMTGPAFKMREDPRVTPLGRLLRRSSLDELPQLWNVIRGEMSLVGPRPPLPEEFVHYEPWHRGRLAVTPGMTCIWQVLGRNEIRDFDTWMELDREYVRNWSLLLDLKLLLRTIPAVLRGHGAY